MLTRRAIMIGLILAPLAASGAPMKSHDLCQWDFPNNDHFKRFLYHPGTDQSVIEFHNGTIVTYLGDPRLPNAAPAVRTGRLPAQIANIHHSDLPNLVSKLRTQCRNRGPAVLRKG